jgi:drug/metabolite transporter (DMT)-like permease
MELLPLLLVLAGSTLHLGWNIFTKKAQDKFAFLWLAVFPLALVGLLYSLPVFIKAQDMNIALFYIIISAAVHAFYFWSLTNAYKTAQLSFVYPYCRGIGTIFTAIGGVILLSESPTSLGLIGITLTIIAVFIEPLGKGLSEVSRPSKAALLFTLATALAIAAYLLIDKVGLRYLDPLAYITLMLFFSTLILIPFIGKDRIKKELRHSKYYSILAGIFLFGAYGLIAYAMKTSPISYVAAVRASGIVFSGVAGILFFQEKVSKTRWGAIALITLGVYFISVAKQ